jgi:hypothetical protein
MIGRHKKEPTWRRSVVRAHKVSSHMLTAAAVRGRHRLERGVHSAPAALAVSKTAVNQIL